jgi:hypothetical protein
MLPDWIKTDVHNKVIELQENMISRQQEGFIVISREQAYFQNNEETFEVLLRKEIRNKSRKILENLEKYKEDLFRFEVDPPMEVKDPYNENDEIVTKISKVHFQLQQNRTIRDRIKTLVYYYLIGKLIAENGQQHLKQLDISKNQMKKLILKGTRTYEIFKRAGKFQIYNTKIISVKILTDMLKENYEELLKSLIF